MASAPLSKELAQQALNEFYKNGKSLIKSSTSLGIPNSTFRARLDSAKRYGLIPHKIYLADPNIHKILNLERELSQLRAINSSLSKETSGLESIKEFIHKATSTPRPPKWTLLKDNKTSNIGIPTLQCCLRGNTKIRLLDGSAKTIEELSKDNKDVWLFSYDIKTNNVVAGKATNIISTKIDTLVKVTFVDKNGVSSFIECTKDHRFLLNNGSYIEAQNLQLNDSLSSVYFNYTYRRGYESFCISKEIRRPVTTHRMVTKSTNIDEFKKISIEAELKGDYVVIHHKDFNAKNNLPDNLIPMLSKDHMFMHRENGVISMTNYNKSDKHRKIASEQAKIRNKTNNPAHIRWKNIEERITQGKRISLIGKSNSGNHSRWKHIGPKEDCNKCNKSNLVLNHKVTSVEFTNEIDTVYDMTVPGYNNFGVCDSLGNLVFVHNSDWHFDEVVYANQINGVNAFNRVISQRRIKTLFYETVDILKNKVANPTYDKIVVLLGGDLLSGNIHEELRETNEVPLAKSLIAILDNLIAGIVLLLDHFKYVEVHGLPGNHGRMDKKPRYKNRVFDNFEWILLQFLMKHFKGEDRVHFNISDGADLRFNIYKTRYLMTHGDQFKGGSGISGVLAPLMLGDHRKRKRSMACDQPYDYLLMGHFHQMLFVKGIIVNGSLKGYDEYAFQNNFEFEVPTQNLWLTHPVYGITTRWPIYLEKPGVRF